MVGAVGLEPTMRGLKGRWFDDFRFAPKVVGEPRLELGRALARHGLNVRLHFTTRRF